MRLTSFASLCLVLLAGCESDEKVLPTAVLWMDWPAEATSGVPFKVRLLMYEPCSWSVFSPGSSADQSAVTFAPYFLGVRQDILCAADASTDLVIGNLDTTGTAPGLEADSPRSYEMRAAALVNTLAPVDSWPVRTFGAVIVRPAGADASRRNAAGIVFSEIDTLGCLRVRPFGAYRPGSALVVENPTDTANLSGAFVRGYIYAPAAPLCGETTVFHLVSRN